MNLDMVPIHPGEILLEEYLKPLGLSAGAFAKRLDVPHFSGYWAAVGGSVNRTDENLNRAIQREMLEETDMFTMSEQFQIVDCFQEKSFKCFTDCPGRFNDYQKRGKLKL